MRSSDFLALAFRLSSSTEEADLRTCVSRAYYGAYRAAIEFLENCGVTLPRSVDSHTKFRWCLDEAKHPAASLASAQLDSLRLDRNQADYDLRNKRFQKRSNVVMSLQGARDVVDALATCNTAADRLILAENIRKYAKNVLNLPAGE